MTATVADTASWHRDGADSELVARLHHSVGEQLTAGGLVVAATHLALPFERMDSLRLGPAVVEAA